MPRSRNKIRKPSQGLTPQNTPSKGLKLRNGTGPSSPRLAVSDFQTSVTKELNAFSNPLHDLRREVLATVASDFELLSDLHELMCREIDQLHYLQQLLVPHVLHLATVQETILGHLDELPEWRTFLSERLPNIGLDSARHHVAEVFRSLQEARNELTLPALPESITRRVHGLPLVREHLTSTFSTVSDEVAKLVRNNIKFLPDIQGLVSEHFHALPVLQQQVQMTYSSSRPVLKSFDACPHYMSDNHYITSVSWQVFEWFSRREKGFSFWH